MGFTAEKRGFCRFPREMPHESTVLPVRALCAEQI